jgi:aspartyl-tRNA(Asn)/glutamyl-tRNA(Gln) amidotransferase subunit C
MAAETQAENVAAGMDVRYVAGLARLELTDAEVAEFERQLAQVVAYFNELRTVDVEGVEPTAHALAVHNVFREDEVRPGLTQEAALANAPAAQAGQFMVPRIIE